MASVDKMAIIGEDFSEDEPKRREPALKACVECFHMSYNATKLCPRCGWAFYRKVGRNDVM